MKNLITPLQFQAMLVLRDEGHFGRAAFRLGIAQPQLSALLRRIEEIAGFRIFERRPAVRLTPAGAVLLRIGSQMLTDVETGIAEARLVASGSKGLVRLGFSPTALLFVPGLSDALTRFAEMHPGVELTFREASATELYHQFRREELDLVVTRNDGTVHPATSTRLVDDRIVVLLPADHPTPPDRAISLRSLNDERFIFFRRAFAPQYVDRIMDAARRAGLNPMRSQEVDSWSAGFALVGSGFGFTLATAVYQRFPVVGARYQEVKDPMPDVGFNLIHDPDRSSASAARLVDHLRAAFAKRDLAE